jgi:hypothetical protein
MIEVAVDASFERFTGALESLLGKMDLAAPGELAALSAEAARAKLASYVGPLDFALFQKIDHGTLLTVLTGGRQRAVTYVFGNALIAVEMTKHDLRAGLYVPLRLLVHEIAAGVRVSYDLPSTQLAQLGCSAIDAVARQLDGKVKRLLDAAAQRAHAPQP